MATPAAGSANPSDQAVARAAAAAPRIRLREPTAEEWAVENVLEVSFLVPGASRGSRSAPEARAHAPTRLDATGAEKYRYP